MWHLSGLFAILLPAYAVVTKRSPPALGECGGLRRPGDQARQPGQDTLHSQGRSVFLVRDRCPRMASRARSRVGVSRWSRSPPCTVRGVSITRSRSGITASRVAFVTGGYVDDASRRRVRIVPRLHELVKAFAVAIARAVAMDDHPIGCRLTSSRIQPRLGARGRSTRIAIWDAGGRTPLPLNERKRRVPLVSPEAPPSPCRPAAGRRSYLHHRSSRVVDGGLSPEIRPEERGAVAP